MSCQHGGRHSPPMIPIILPAAIMGFEGIWKKEVKMNESGKPERVVMSGRPPPPKEFAFQT
jgi:hypothetical protein